MNLLELNKINKALSVFLLILFPPALFLGNAPSDILISFISILFLINCLITKDYSWFKQTWVQAAFIFWGYIVINSLFVDNIKGALSSALPFCRFFIFSIAIYYWLLTEEKNKKYVFYSILITVVFFSANSIFQYICGFDIFGQKPIDMGRYIRLTSPTGKMIVGIVLASINFVVTAWALKKLSHSANGMKEKAALIGLIFFPLMAIFLSGERTALLISILGYAILFFKDNKYKKQLLGALTLFCILAVLIVSFTKLQVLDRQVNRTYEEIVNFSSSSYGKIYFTAISIFKDHQVFGIGAKQFRIVCNNELSEHPEYFCATHPHNVFLHILVEFGYVGMLTFLMLIFYLAKLCWDKRKIILKDNIAFAAMLAFWSKYIPIISVSSYFIAWSAGPSWFMLGILLSRIKNAKK